MGSKRPRTWILAEINKTMKLQSFSQFITESTLTVSTVESKISATAHRLLPEKAWARAKKYLDLDFNVLINRAAATATGIFTDLATTLNNPNFDPKTIEAVALKFEQALYSLTNREVDLIMQGVGPLAKGLLFAFKGKWRTEFLAKNSDWTNSNIGTIVEDVISLALESGPDFETGCNQKQLVKAGKLVPPFNIKVDGRTYSYGKYYDHGRKFADGSTRDGCYTLDYWEAMDALLEDRKPRITKTIVTNIAAKVFS